MSKPVCVVWVNEAKVYEQALTRTGLVDRFELHSLKIDQTIPDDLAARADILVGWRPGTYLKRMPRLRWIQAMTAGVDLSVRNRCRRRIRSGRPKASWYSRISVVDILSAVQPLLRSSPTTRGDFSPGTR